MTAYNKQYWKANKDKINERRRVKYNSTDQEECKKKKREEYQQDKEAVLERHKIYKTQNKDKRLEQQRRYRARKKNGPEGVQPTIQKD